MTVTTAVEVRCKVPLIEHIVLATQEDVAYSALSWSLLNGDVVSVEMVVDADKMRRDYAEYSGEGNYYVNSRVEHLSVSISMPNVSADDLDRLSAKHPTAEFHRAHLVNRETGVGVDIDFQDAEAFGKRVSAEIREAVNYVLELVRDSYGQHWLKLEADDGDGPENFLEKVRAEYLIPPSAQWKRLLVGPHVVNIGNVMVGGAKQFIEISDWTALQAAVQSGTRPSVLLTLLSETNERFERGDKQLAVIHLSSALEEAVASYLSAHLTSRIPKKPLDQILDQSHGRLLEDWVWPLNGSVGIGITQDEWQAVKRVQKLRQQAGHVFLSDDIKALSDIEFMSLVRKSSAVVKKLTGIHQLKTPSPLVGIGGGGTAPSIKG